MPEAARPPFYLFEGFRLDARRRVLFAPDGRQVALRPRLVDTLLYFVERAGQLLTKEQLLADLWPNVVVEEHNLNKTVSELRRALGEKRGEHRFIVTQSGRGYRFVADVATASRCELVGTNGSALERPAAPAPLPADAKERSAELRRPHSSLFAMAALAVLAIGVGAALVGNRAFGPSARSYG